MNDDYRIIATKTYVDKVLDEKLDKSAMTDIEAFIYEAIYGFIDGTIENISNSSSTYVRDYAFYEHPSLITAEFSSATNIGNYSFYKCTELSSINALSANTIGAFSFKGCSMLTSVDFPLATTIGQGSFDECTTLSSVNVPQLVMVEPLTFRKCECLTTIDLPVATSIKAQAFYNSGIINLTLRLNTVCTLEDENAFYFTLTRIEPRILTSKRTPRFARRNMRRIT